MTTPNARSVVCRVFKDKHLLPWIGVEIALNVLRNVDLTRDELRCITNEDVPLATVSAVKMVQFNLQESDVEPNKQRVRQPYTIRIGTVDLEIQTWCAIIQALQFRQCDAAATNLAFEISAALVSCFLGQILGHCDTDKLPFTLCDLAGRSDSKSYSLEAMEDEKESKRPEPIWPRDTIVDVSTFAFLFDVLSVDERLTQAAFAHHRKCILKRPDQDEEAMRGIHSGNEIRDLIGLIGLFLPRVPLPLTDTDQFDADNWLAVQLMSRPITVNWMVLCQIAQFVRDHTAHWYLAPPSSLIRVILYHAPSDAETLKLVLEPVLCCLSFPCPKAAETEHLVLLNSLNSQLVEELAVLAILRLSDYVDRQKILDAIFTQNGYLRETLFDIAKSLRIRMLHSSISVQCDTDRLSYVARALKVKKSEITLSSYCPDHDNQTDEQKLMRLIFKLSEHSLRMSKSCKGYSRSDDLSWLTEQVLEMGEQGFSFFLTCLGGDLSEMITAGEAFQMCKTSLKKFKIFFPLDAPNKKTPDRPEGATALVNGILEHFTDVAYKNSNWSEIELHTSSMSSSLVAWMAQHLRVIAPVKQVPLSILLSTSEETFNKQKFRSSSVGSMSLQQDVYEDTTPPLVDLAFDLGVLELTAFSSESRTDDDTTNKMCSYMSNFCELVSYIGQKRWSKNWNRTRENIKERRRLARRRGLRAVTHGIVASTAFWRSNSELESAYLSPFVDALIEAVCDPMLLDQCLREVSTSLYSDHNKLNWEDFEDWFQVSRAVDCYSSLSKLLVKTIEAFKKRVLGPKTKELVTKFINQPNKPPHRNASEEFSLEYNLRSYLVEILMAAKGVINTRDPSGSTYRELVTSLVTQEPALKDFDLLDSDQ